MKPTDPSYAFEGQVNLSTEDVVILSTEDVVNLSTEDEVNLSTKDEFELSTEDVVNLSTEDEVNLSTEDVVNMSSSIMSSEPCELLSVSSSSRLKSIKKRKLGLAQFKTISAQKKRKRYKEQSCENEVSILDDYDQKDDNLDKRKTVSKNFLEVETKLLKNYEKFKKLALRSRLEVGIEKLEYSNYQTDLDELFDEEDRECDYSGPEASEIITVDGHDDRRKNPVFTYSELDKFLASQSLSDPDSRFLLPSKVVTILLMQGNLSIMEILGLQCSDVKEISDNQHEVKVVSGKKSKGFIIKNPVDPLQPDYNGILKTYLDILKMKHDGTSNPRLFHEKTVLDLTFPIELAKSLGKESSVDFTWSSIQNFFNDKNLFKGSENSEESSSTSLPDNVAGGHSEKNGGSECSLPVFLSPVFRSSELEKFMALQTSDNIFWLVRKVLIFLVFHGNLSLDQILGLSFSDIQELSNKELKIIVRDKKKIFLKSVVIKKPGDPATRPDFNEIFKKYLHLRGKPAYKFSKAILHLQSLEDLEDIPNQVALFLKKDPDLKFTWNSIHNVLRDTPQETVVVQSTDCEQDPEDECYPPSDNQNESVDENYDKWKTRAATSKPFVRLKGSILKLHQDKSSISEKCPQQNFGMIFGDHGDAVEKVKDFKLSGKNASVSQPSTTNLDIQDGNQSKGNLHSMPDHENQVESPKLPVFTYSELNKFLSLKSYDTPYWLARKVLTILVMHGKLSTEDISNLKYCTLLEPSNNKLTIITNIKMFSIQKTNDSSKPDYKKIFDTFSKRGSTKNHHFIISAKLLELLTEDVESVANEIGSLLGKDPSLDFSLSSIANFYKDGNFQEDNTSQEKLSVFNRRGRPPRKLQQQQDNTSTVSGSSGANDSPVKVSSNDQIAASADGAAHPTEEEVSVKQEEIEIESDSAFPDSPGQGCEDDEDQPKSYLACCRGPEDDPTVAAEKLLTHGHEGPVKLEKIKIDQDSVDMGRQKSFYDFRATGKEEVVEDLNLVKEEFKEEDIFVKEDCIKEQDDNLEEDSFREEHDEIFVEEDCEQTVDDLILFEKDPLYI